MSELRTFGNKALREAIIILAAALLASLLFMRWDVALGILLGGTFSCVKLLQSLKKLEALGGLSASSGIRFGLLKSFNRYGLAALCFTAAFLFKPVNPWAAVIAYFITNVTLITNAIRERNHNSCPMER